jgi:hypothetical protein
MKITNNYNLPKPILNSLKNNRYKKGRWDYSISDLIKPPQELKLKKEHYKDITKDITDCMFALEGTILHNILQGSFLDKIKRHIKNIFSNQKEIIEKRKYIRIKNKTISGQPDRVLIDKKNKTVIIQDWKRVSVWKDIIGDYTDYETQLNCYAFFYERLGYKVKSLELILFFRDWSYTNAQRKAEYPKQQIITKKIKKWSAVVTLDYIFTAIEDLREKKTRPCTKNEMWIRDEAFAVKQKNVQKAKRVFATKAEAQNYIDENFNDNKNIYIEYRPGTATKCERYCDVSNFCTQYKNFNLKKEENKNGK